MRHAHTHRRRPQFIEDPDTGKRYPIPQGGDENDDGNDGGADDEDDDQDDDDGDADSSTGDDDGDDGADEDKPLGPAGEKALQALKAERRDLKRQLREARAANNKPAGDPDDTDDPDKLREKIRAEVRAEGATERALDKLETKAARKFQNPTVARAMLKDRADEFLDDQGNPDLEAIGEALDDLLETDPYLAAQSSKRFEGSGDGGTRNGAKSGQLTRDDLKRMSPEAIEKARSEGKLDTVLGIKR